MITGIDHAALVVADIRAMTAFYRDVCGLAVRGGRELHTAFGARVLGYEDAHVHVVMLGAEGDTTKLELIEYVNPLGSDGHGPKNALGAGHVCFNVDDLEATYQKLSGAGMRFVASPTSEVTASGQIHSVCYAQDPEGNWVEFRSLSG
jgi:catechol 2,3-dioxygenase-like lactoylglutathione lyase family enzyme